MSDEAASRGGPLVVGLGSPDQGDDAVGLEVARAVEALCLPGVRTAIVPTCARVAALTAIRSMSDDTAFPAR